MQLDEQQLAAFHRDGVVLLPGLFSPSEVERLRAAFDVVCGEDTPANVRERKSGVVRTAMGLHLRHPIFADLVRDARLVALAREAARETVRHDPGLARTPDLARAVRLRWGERLTLVGVG